MSTENLAIEQQKLLSLCVCTIIMCFVDLGVWTIIRFAFDRQGENWNNGHYKFYDIVRLWANGFRLCDKRKRVIDGMPVIVLCVITINWSTHRRKKKKEKMNGIRWQVEMSHFKWLPKSSHIEYRPHHLKNSINLCIFTGASLSLFYTCTHTFWALWTWASQKCKALSPLSIVLQNWLCFFSLPAFLFVCHGCFSTCSLAALMMRWTLFHRTRTNNKNTINNRQCVFKTYSHTHTRSFVCKANDIDKNRARPSRSVFGQWTAECRDKSMWCAIASLIIVLISLACFRCFFSMSSSSSSSTTSFRYARFSVSCLRDDYGNVICVQSPRF